MVLIEQRRRSWYVPFQGSFFLVEKHIFFGIEGPKMVLKLIQNGLKIVPTDPKWVQIVPPHPHPLAPAKVSCQGANKLELLFFLMIF